MAVVISESDMRFGEYEEEQVFRLEKSTQYTKNLKPNGIKTCDFILRRGKKLYFIEAKSSCPKQITAGTAEEKKVKYDEDIQSIVLKMRHSLAMYASILLLRYEADSLPELIKQADMSGLQIIFMLVVKNARNEWLIPYQDVFRRELKAELRIWKPADFFVINEATARKKHFIL